MSDNILDQRWPWLLAAAVIVGAYLFSTTMYLDDGNSGADPRPVGGRGAES